MIWAFVPFALACAVQPWVASDPLIHMLVQYPLLATAGYLLAYGVEIRRDLAGPVLILALVTAAVWMLPRSVDAALTTSFWHVAKFLTIPLTFGVPLAMSWRLIGPILRGFLKLQSISMLLFLGFLYTHAPIRICNSYLINDQQRLGYGFTYLAIALTLIWIIPVFLTPTENRREIDLDERA